MENQTGMPSVAETRKALGQAAKTGWEAFNAALLAGNDNTLVDATWSVEYDALGNDIILQAKIAVKDSADVLLQVWLMDEHPGIWIPQYRPWVASVVEFDPSEGQKTAHVGLFDSKWRAEDQGETYGAFLWGWVMHKGKPKRFGFEKEFVYPGGGTA